MCGGVLLSRGASPAVPSALKGLTSGFGMGPGVSLSLWPPKRYGDVAPARGGAGGARARIPRTAQWTRDVVVVLSPRPVSTGQLRALRRFHVRPINPVV